MKTSDNFDSFAETCERFGNVAQYDAAHLDVVGAFHRLAELHEREIAELRECLHEAISASRIDCGADFQRSNEWPKYADSIEAAHKCEIAEMKHWIKSAARWIKCHDIYHTSGDDLIKQAKEILNDNGEFLFKKGEQ